MSETKTRSLVKAIIYRIWVLFTTYVLLLVTGESLADAVIPTIVINCIWTASYYFYDRIWNKIRWGK